MKHHEIFQSVISPKVAKNQFQPSKNPVQCPFYHLCEGAVPWYPISFSPNAG